MEREIIQLQREQQKTQMIPLRYASRLSERFQWGYSMIYAHWIILLLLLLYHKTI